MRRIGLLLILATLVAAPVANGAKRKHLKLTATFVRNVTVTTPAGGKTPGWLYVVTRQGSKKKVGTLTVAINACANNGCAYAGTANLKVGKVTDKAKLRTASHITGACPPCSPPRRGKFESNTGTISNPKHGSETIRVNGDWPNTKGSKVTFVLSY